LTLDAPSWLNAFEWSIAFADAALVTEKDQSARMSLVLDIYRAARA